LLSFAPSCRVRQLNHVVARGRNGLEPEPEQQLKFVFMLRHADRSRTKATERFETDPVAEAQELVGGRETIRIRRCSTG